MEPSKITRIEAQRRERLLKAYLLLHELRMLLQRGFLVQVTRRTEIEANHSRVAVAVVVVVVCILSLSRCNSRKLGVLDKDRRGVSLEESNVAKELVFPRKRSATGTEPLVLPAVLLVCFQVRNDGELLGVATAASEALVAVGAFVVVLDAEDRFQRLELFVLLVPFATREWARVPFDQHRLRPG